MSDPYRSAHPSEPCLRCRKPMDVDAATGDLVCSSRCGSWIAAKAVDKLLPPDAVKAGARGNPFKASPFAPARCPRCKTALEDLYAGTKKVISFGRCIEHGIWIDRETRSTFEEAYAEQIAQIAAVRGVVDDRVRALDAEVDAFAERLAGDATIDRKELARRVVVLERALVEQSQRIEQLERAMRALAANFSAS